MKKKRNPLFGIRVKCFGYLKKQKLKYVCAIGGDEPDCSDYLILDDEPIFQNRYVYTSQRFSGIIIGVKDIAVAYEFNSIDDETVICNKDTHIKCYVVAYRMGCKRYVPVNKVVVEMEARVTDAT